MQINVPEAPTPTAVTTPTWLCGWCPQERGSGDCLPAPSWSHSVARGKLNEWRMSLGIDMSVRIGVCPWGTVPECEATQKFSLRWHQSHQPRAGCKGSTAHVRNASLTSGFAWQEILPHHTARARPLANIRAIVPGLLAQTHNEVSES